jgi:hypothetical protein
MADRKQRLDSLKAFKPAAIASYVDEDEMVEYELVFYPHLNMFKVHRSDTPQGIPSLPLMAISYNDFIERVKAMKLNRANVLDRIILRLREDWDSVPEDRRNDFFDSIPLNSLFLGEGR